MKSTIIKYLLIVSLLMNLSFLGAAAYTRYTRPQYRAVPSICPGVAPDKVAPFGHGLQRSHLIGELSLKPEQIKPVQEKATAFHSAMGAKRQEIARLRSSLVALIREDHPDREAIGGAISGINSVQQEMQKMVVSHILEFKSMLHKKQQEKFLDLIEKAMGERGEAVCP